MKFLFKVIAATSIIGFCYGEPNLDIPQGPEYVVLPELLKSKSEEGTELPLTVYEEPRYNLASKATSETKELSVPIAKKALPYAIMADAAYQYTKEGNNSRKKLEDIGYDIMSENDLENIVGSSDYLYDATSGRITSSGYTGLQVLIFKNEDQQEIVISFAGVELPSSAMIPSSKYWISISKIVRMAETLGRAGVGHLFGINPKLYAEAVNLANKVREEFSEDYKISTTGSSMGGGQAQVAALAIGGNAFCFNSIGLSTESLDAAFNVRNIWDIDHLFIDTPLPQSPELWDPSTKNIVLNSIQQFNLEGDPLTKYTPKYLYGEQLGQIYQIPLNEDSAWSRHLSNAVVANLTEYIKANVGTIKDFAVTAPTPSASTADERLNIEPEDAINSWFGIGGAAFDNYYNKDEFSSFTMDEEQLSSDDSDETSAQLLIRAVQEDQVGDAEQILKEGGVNVDQRDANGATALMYAALNCNSPMVKLLIARGANIFARDAEGKTVLHYLAKGALSIREYLRTVRYIDQKAEETEGGIAKLYSTKDYNGHRPAEYSMLTMVRERLEKFLNDEHALSRDQFGERPMTPPMQGYDQFGEKIREER